MATNGSNLEHPHKTFKGETANKFKQLNQDLRVLQENTAESWMKQGSKFTARK